MDNQPSSVAPPEQWGAPADKQCGYPHTNEFAISDTSGSSNDEIKPQLLVSQDSVRRALAGRATDTCRRARPGASGR